MKTADRGLEVNKKVFWMGVAVLVVGIMVFAYGYQTIQNIKDSAYPYPLSTYLTIYPEIETQWYLAQVLQPLGFGLLVLGAIILAYSLLVKKETRSAS